MGERLHMAYVFKLEAALAEAEEAHAFTRGRITETAEEMRGWCAKDRIQIQTWAERLEKLGMAP